MNIILCTNNLFNCQYSLAYKLLVLISLFIWLRLVLNFDDLVILCHVYHLGDSPEGQSISCAFSRATSENQLIASSHMCSHQIFVMRILFKHPPGRSGWEE